LGIAANEGLQRGFLRVELFVVVVGHYLGADEWCWRKDLLCDMISTECSCLLYGSGICSV
jgi:hypothetical protein